jgi:isopentenyl-diphosphate delta-isomerase
MKMHDEKVILVDEHDMMLGTMEKLEAHQKGVLHRAFSLFVFNNSGELILQQRDLRKYHSPGLWSNTCCSHPREGESVEQAAHRRLVEEMGFDTQLEKRFSFIYKADVGQGLTEHEFDHVLFGFSDAAPRLNPEEAMAWEAVSTDALSRSMSENPEMYTVWFRIAWPRVMAYLGK